MKWWKNIIFSIYIYIYICAKYYIIFYIYIEYVTRHLLSTRCVNSQSSITSLSIFTASTVSACNTFLCLGWQTTKKIKKKEDLQSQYMAKQKLKRQTILFTFSCLTSSGESLNHGSSVSSYSADHRVPSPLSSPDRSWQK